MEGCKEASNWFHGSPSIDAKLTDTRRDYQNDWKETAKLYQLWIYSEGLEVVAEPEKGIQARKGMTHEDLEAVERLKGKMPRAQSLSCRVRYFSDGAVLAGAEFVEKIFNHNRGHFGEKRKTGARKMRGAEWGDLCVIRDLRREVITKT